MRQFAPQMQVQGIVTLRLRNAITLELEEERVIENTLTNLAERRWCAGRSFLSNESGGIHNDISISEDSVLAIPSIRAFPKTTAQPANVVNRDTNITGTGSPLVLPWSRPLDDGPPVFFSTEQRFLAPGSDRTIRSVMLGQGQTSNTSMYAYAEVSPACVQTTTQVLDITYRVQWFFQPGTADSTSVSVDYGRALADRWGVLDPGNTAGIFPDSAIRFWTGKVSPSPDVTERWPTTGSAAGNLGISTSNQSTRNPDGSATSTFSGDSGGPLAHYRIDHEIDKDFNDNVGQIYGSIGYGIAGSSGQLVPRGLCVFAPFAPTDFANKPVQPIHNHSVDAIEPFLDVDFLASSQGEITVDGSSWTDDDYPEFYRVDVYGTAGAVGAGPRYAIRKRNTFGFEESSVNGEGTYKTQQDPISFLYDGMNSNILFGASALDDSTSIIGSHGIKNQRYREEYDLTKTVTFNKKILHNGVLENRVDDGISIVDLVDGTFVNFDTTTTPALSGGGGNIIQTAVDDSGNVYVADRARGLFKITDPFGAPSIVHFSFAVHGIPSAASDIACYGVAIGNGGSVWAMFEDGLSETTDGGTSWTNYDPAAGSFATEDFEFAGITDGNWSNVHFIRANRDAADPNNEIGIAKIQPTAPVPARESDIVWWTKASGGTTSAGPSAADGFNNANSTSFKCSRRGGVWAYTDVDFTGGGTGGQIRVSTVVFGSSSRTGVTESASNQGDMTEVNFFYDSYGAPHIMAGGSGPTREAIFALDGPTKIAHTEFNGNQRGGIYYSPEGDPRGICTGVANMPSNSGDNTPGPDLIATVSPEADNASGLVNASPELNSLNLTDSAMQEMVWENYNWDGGSFTKGFHVPAVDTAPGFGSGLPPFPGLRTNFHTEDQTFTGRALTDVSAIFTGPTFTGPASDATFTFTVTPADKLDTVSANGEQRQEDERILFSIEDPAVPGSTFRVWWQDPGGFIAIENATGSLVSTGIPTPADGAPYRVNVIVDQSGTSGHGPPGIYVFWDAGIGVVTPAPVFPIPLAHAYDWSGPTPIGYLGSRVFPPWQVPVTTPHPYYFYRGAMVNVQYWNTPFPILAVFDDITTLSGLGVTVLVPPGPTLTALVAVHDNTAVLTGLETKATHFSSDTLINGLDIAFDDGSSGDSFVPTDYFTFGVCDGVMKDNAIEMTQQFSLYTKPVDLTFSDFENAGATATVPAGTATVTETLIWQERSLYNSGSRGVRTASSDALRPGEWVNGILNLSSQPGAVSHQGLTGDGEFQWTLFFGGQDGMHIGFTTNPTFGGGSESHTFTTASNLNASARFNADGSVDTYEGAALDSAGVTTYVTGDEFRMVRVGTTISLVKVTGGPVTVRTFPSALAGTIGVRVNVQAGFSDGVTGATITYTRPALFMTIGHDDGVPALRTGIFNADYLRCETDILDSISIEADAVPLTITKSETFLTSMVAPGPGEVIINGEAGWLKFNAGESGKTITGSLTVIFDKI